MQNMQGDAMQRSRSLTFAVLFNVSEPDSSPLRHNQGAFLFSGT
jgi:hypothetical protein